MDTKGFSLFAQPSFFEGMARLLDINGSLNQCNGSKTPEEADYRAILSDWEHVGQDLLLAAKQIARKSEPISHDQK